MADTRTTNAQGSSDPIAIYWRDIKDYQPLTRHREGELVKLARRGSIEAMHEKWRGNYEKLEKHHSYIQWLFPIFEGPTTFARQESRGVQ